MQQSQYTLCTLSLKLYRHSFTVKIFCKDFFFHTCCCTKEYGSLYGMNMHTTYVCVCIFYLWCLLVKVMWEVTP